MSYWGKVLGRPDYKEVRKDVWECHNTPLRYAPLVLTPATFVTSMVLVPKVMRLPNPVLWIASIGLALGAGALPGIKVAACHREVLNREGSLLAQARSELRQEDPPSRWSMMVEPEGHHH